MSMETTLVLVKPDGVQRGLIGEVIRRMEAKGLQIVGLKFLVPPQAVLEKHYAVHADKPFFGDLLAFMSSGPVAAIAAKGEGAIQAVRNMMGSTDGSSAASGTIRGDFGMSKQFNMVHGSDAVETAAFELPIWFADGELVEDYRLESLDWVYGK